MEPTTTRSPPNDMGNRNNSQDSNEKVRFMQVLRYWFGYVHHSNTTPSPFHTWFAQNVHPLVTPKRILCFHLSQLSFLLAYSFFTQTDIYKSYLDHHHSFIHQASPQLFFAAAFSLHNVTLTFLLFFSFCSTAFERYRYHYILKTIGEHVVKVSVVSMVMGIGDHYYAAAPTSDLISDAINYSKVAGLATWCLLTVDALCIINLLEPGHHCALLEATVTLTLHLGFTTGNSVRIPAAAFVLLILLIKNFLWRHAFHPQAPPSNQPSPLASVGPEIV